MASHTTHSQVSEQAAGVLKDQVTEWCADWAAETGMSLLGKIYLQTLLTHWVDRGMSFSDIQQQLGTVAAGIGKLGRAESSAGVAPVVASQREAEPEPEPEPPAPARQLSEQELLPIEQEPESEQDMTAADSDGTAPEAVTPAKGD
jgi:hypothetical protein